MGYHIPVVKEKAKLELRDPEIYHDKVPDKRAYGNPYKNPDKVSISHVKKKLIQKFKQQILLYLYLFNLFIIYFSQV
jgi:hypothetical protein